MLDIEAEIARRQARSVTWFVPVSTRSPLNRRRHWRPVYTESVEQSEATEMHAPRDIAWQLPVVVVLRRLYCGSNPLDPHDNLPSALKHCVDSVARIVGVDDGDQRFCVKYEQERVKKRAEVGVQITVIQGARIVETLVFDDDRQPETP